MPQPHEIFQVSINGNPLLELDGNTLDFVATGPHTFHILLHGKRYNAELIQADYAAKTFRLNVNGSLYEVKLADQYDQLVEKLGLSKRTGTKIKDILAPMPGMVLELHITEGQAVEKGQALLILEAMKMENVLKAPGDGIVKRICVQKGSPVDKNQLLLEME